MKKTLMMCKGCGKPLISRAENGIWNFKYGKHTPVDAEAEKEKLARFKECLSSALAVDQALSERGIDSHEYLIAHENLIEHPHEDESISDYINRISLKIKNLEFKRYWVPIEMFIFGSVKLRCYRKDCGHWNVFNFFPFREDFNKDDGDNTF